ncbi:BolA family protein [Halothiobacillus sp. DCM-1]|uniref:BolA family protein n=1 Tax=Halothiobacillus sp. DCM-1 TaxID=3112558 RepID=UPI00324BD5EF
MNTPTLSRRDRIQHALTAHFAPVHLSVDNESHQHAGQRQESHYRVVIVSSSFAGQPLLARHRMINAVLSAERDQGLHALALHAYSPDEWQARGQDAPASPVCAGAHA